MNSFNRRLFLAGGLASTGVVAASGVAFARSASAVDADPFQLGVASGDPRPDGMVLWTRLAPEPLKPDGGMGEDSVEVTWELATDEAFTDIVDSGTEPATPADGHSVHAEPKKAQPGTAYFYRFHVGAEPGRHTSDVGRTRTAPAPGSAVASLTFAFASCAHYETGYYHAYNDLADSKPDLVLFLGDYIYERSTDEHRVRKYQQAEKIKTLGEYRVRYAEHKSDPALQRAHAVAPWVPVFDDHEIENNWWGDDSEVPADQRQAAFRAFWENMPLPMAMKPADARIALYRRLEWGDLARFHMLDTRQHRAEQAADGDCGAINDGGRSLTGDPQEKWLLDGLTARNTGWDFLAQQVFFAGRDKDDDPDKCDISEDAWDGYAPNRKRITQGWVDRKVRNPVVLTGDVHRAWAADLRVDYAKHETPIVGAELVTTSITSLGSTSRPDLTNLPHINYIGHKRGYVRATLTPAELRAEFVEVSSALEEDPKKVTFPVARRFRVLDGVPGLRDG